jgi:ribosomal protein S3AE
MRNNILAYLARTIKKMTYEDFIGELISHKLQSEMRGVLSKIYPIKVCEIRYAGIEAREKPQEIKAEIAEQK